MSPPQRRIEDRIRELCARAADAIDGEMEPTLRELSQLLHETIEHMRKSATSLLVKGKPLSEPRRRATDREVGPLGWDKPRDKRTAREDANVGGREPPRGQET